MPFELIVKTPQSSDGIPIHAELIGDTQKPCIVFVHGVTLSSLVFDGLFHDRMLLREVCMVSTYID